MTVPYRDLVQSLLNRADVVVDGNRAFDIKVKDPRFFKRFLKDGRVGLGESYMENWWDCDDLAQMFYNLTRAKIIDAKDKINRQFIYTMLKAKLIPEGGERRSHRIGRKHYDIGNELYQCMLDKRLVYTCGYWSHSDGLEKAQEAKLELICKKLQLKPGMHVLDVGCGWGSFAKYAAQNYDVRVTGITISKEQINLGKRLCQGLPIELRYQDYRDVSETFDRIVSIGMFEHVGRNFYRTYFKKMRECLNDNGLFLLHTIGTNKSNWSNAWLTKYIFPGGYIPCLKDIGEDTEGLLILEDLHNFGPSYDKTLCAWYENFDKNWDQLKTNYDETFYRMWKYYLLSSAGGFRSRFAHLWQFVFSKEGLVGGYQFEGNYEA